MTDLISDMLNRIRNAQAVHKSAVELPWSKLNYEIAKILEKNGFVGAIEKKGRLAKKSIKAILKYQQENDMPRAKTTPVINGIKRVSRPGQRIYAKSLKIKRVRGGYGMAIISTPKGLMTDQEARRKKLGGEVLFEIW